MSIRLNYAEMIASSFTLSTLLVNPKCIQCFLYEKNIR